MTNGKPSLQILHTPFICSASVAESNSFLVVTYQFAVLNQPESRLFVNNS